MRDVKRDELRWMLKRIAMGLAVSPLALIAACQCYPPCPESVVELRRITQAQLNAWGASRDCSVPCGLYGGPRSVPPTDCVRVETPDASGLDAAASDSDAGPAATFAWVECTFTPTCIGGRRPADANRLAELAPAQGVATWLTETAQLEAASVDAFAELRAELIAHQAPSNIIAATSRAEADEVVHAQLIGAFARRAGAKPVRPNVVIGAPRALFDIAKHNASEGCVREAFGAINALHQASNAATPELREGFLRIARDEARHALLSLTLDDWMRTKLNAQQVRALAEEREVAAEELACNVGLEDRETRSVLGLPDEERGRDLVRLCA